MTSPSDISRDRLNADAAKKSKEQRRDRSEAVRNWAQRKLDAGTEAPPPQAPAVTKRKSKPKRSKAKSARRTVLAEAAARSEVNRLVSKEAQRNGDYRMVPFVDIEVTEGGKRVKKEVRVVRNLGRTQIERWHARGVFNERQMAAILFYQEAYRKVFGEGPRVTASYSPAVARSAQGALELWAGSRIGAREALKLIDNEVNFKFEVTSGVWPVWQNVVIWDEPSGVAGGRIGFTHKPAEAAAKVIVLMVSSMIADIVIDSSRRDFGDLLIDLDAPRKAAGGRKP